MEAASFPHELEKDFKRGLARVVVAFEGNEKKIVNKAAQECGSVALFTLRAQMDALKEAYYKVLQRRLDPSHARFEEMLTGAIGALGDLESAFASPGDIEGLIDKIYRVIYQTGNVYIALSTNHCYYEEMSYAGSWSRS